MICAKNIRDREKNQRFLQEQAKKKLEAETTVEQEDGGTEQ